jgi:hypothetical protein
MKEGLRTLRGRLATSEFRRIIVDDGMLDHGHRVISFQVFPYAPAGATQQTPVTLGISPSMGPNMDASDNSQIGWSITTYGTGPLEGGGTSVIDPNHIIVRDLFIRNENPNDQVNYIIVIQPVKLTEDQAIMALIKERNQGELRP